MRIPVLAVSALVSLALMAAPAQAQTYDPSYPVCMQVNSMQASYIECTFVSLAQCTASASGRNAMCVVNPYFAGAQKVSKPDRRQLRVY
jgi:hypothetical protein